MHHNHEADDEELLPPSKTQIKAEMQELQKLGSELVELSPGHLARIDMPDDLRLAVRDWQRFSKHEARRRQLQYIGKLMRNIDPEPIRAGLALLRGESAVEIAKLHRLERLRDRLLEDEQVLQEILVDWPQADLGHLRQLRRNALKEKEGNKPPKNFRAIFQALKELMEQSHGED
ncbi:MAG TPA: ribosome biogenesis factor YjgA [Rhodocyclaceae bacterium]|nr:ribosome biogenesis factor YjgA [Rhodocyclaceae bacterium]